MEDYLAHIRLCVFGRPLPIPAHRHRWANRQFAEARAALPSNCPATFVNGR